MKIFWNKEFLFKIVFLKFLILRRVCYQSGYPVLFSKKKGGLLKFRYGEKYFEFVVSWGGEP